MTLKPHYLYVILLVLLSIYFIYKYNDKAKAESVEGYRNLNLPSFDEYMKYSQGYKCDENLDTLPYELKSKYDIKSFCDDSSVPASSCNVKYVYDSSNFTRFRKETAVNKGYNDTSFGGNDHNGSASALKHNRR